FAPSFLVVLAAVFLVALAGFRRRALDTLGFLARAPCPRLLFGSLALFVFARTRVPGRLRARGSPVPGKRSQHDPRCFRRHSTIPCRCCGGLAWRSGALGRGAAIGDRRLGLGLAGTGNTALNLFDHNGLAAAMTEALAHDALLDAAAL